MDNSKEKRIIIAIDGYSSTGKSTMAKALAKRIGYAYIDTGAMYRAVTLYCLDHGLIDGDKVDEAALQQQLPSINITFGVDSATDEEVVNAAKIANAYDFIMATEKGFDTNIGDRGANLSGGQRQRLSIARAILKNPPILILDEATSALDTESEHLVQEALDHLMSGRTTLVIAHRLSTIKNADTICVLQEGKIVERGTHDELIARGGVYKHLVDMQKF